MVFKHSIVERLASEAIRLGAKTLEIEYNDGHDEVFAATGEVGYGITRLRSTSPEATSLRGELHDIARQSRRVAMGDGTYELRCRVFESFGEDAFRVEIRLVNTQIGPRSRRKRASK
jgi:hypothetical protein